MKTFHHYDIAYKRKNELNYKIVAPPKYGWIADPFLINFNGKLYLFAEIFLYLSERNGVLGYCVYENGLFGEWSVTMDRPWHISYPNVFLRNDRIHMVPETHQLSEVAEYELVAFPDKWQKVHTYLLNADCCDSTFIDYTDGKKYMFTFEPAPVSPYGKGIIYNVDDGILTNKRVFSESLEGARCGGKIIYKQGKCYRLGQNCTKEYGGGLIIYEIDEIGSSYREHEITRIDPTDIEVDSDIIYTGIHTYNSCEDLEVVDLRYTSSTIEENEASDRVHRVFVNKY